jgi:hypothetical protein
MGYCTLLSQSGILNGTALPPRMPFLVILPLFTFILFITSRPAFKTLLSRVPDHMLIYVQAFRIMVELLLFKAFEEGNIPQLTTFEGINFDILVGITALPMGYLVQHQKIGRQGILIWNIASVVVLAVTVGSFTYSFFFTNWVAASGSFAILQMPSLLLPAFLMPLAVFIHVCSIRKQLLKG